MANIEIIGLRRPAVVRANVTKYLESIIASQSSTKIASNFFAQSNSSAAIDIWVISTFTTTPDKLRAARMDLQISELRLRTRTSVLRRLIIVMLPSPIALSELTDYVTIVIRWVPNKLSSNDYRRVNSLPRRALSSGRMEFSAFHPFGDETFWRNTDIDIACTIIERSGAAAFEQRR